MAEGNFKLHTSTASTYREGRPGFFLKFLRIYDVSMLKIAIKQNHRICASSLPAKYVYDVDAVNHDRWFS